MTEKKILVNTINGLLTELNCKTKIRKIIPKEMINALPKMHWFPVVVRFHRLANGYPIRHGIRTLNWLIFSFNSWLMEATAVRSVTLDCNWMVRLLFYA